ncbi:MAG: squalene/phytoene synthase family protein [Burkholderia sp.]|nr:squalene/phytoene synthase family protein [Burkholderia sp.]
MNFDEYCQQKSTPAGSSIYYAIRQAHRSVQPVLTALFALRRELEEIGKKTRDLNVGYTKLIWWKNEISALAEGCPSHPVTHALAIHHQLIDVEYNLLYGIISGYMMDINKTRYLNFLNLKKYISMVGVGFSLLVARACISQLKQIGSYNWTDAVGHALMLTKFVQELGNDARHGHIYLPINELQQYDVTVADLLNCRYSSSFTKLMAFQISRARDALSIAKSAIPKDEYYIQRTLHTQIALAKALLAEIEREGYQVLHQHITLTPIRKLWISWRGMT